MFWFTLGVSRSRRLDLHVRFHTKNWDRSDSRLFDFRLLGIMLGRLLGLGFNACEL